jgi:hypothetical protein
LNPDHKTVVWFSLDINLLTHQFSGWQGSALPTHQFAILWRKGPVCAQRPRLLAGNVAHCTTITNINFKVIGAKELTIFN